MTAAEQSTAQPRTWRHREIENFDRALAKYVTERQKLDEDGHGELRIDLINEILDRRNKLTAEIAQGLP